MPPCASAFTPAFSLSRKRLPVPPAPRARGGGGLFAFLHCGLLPGGQSKLRKAGTAMEKTYVLDTNVLIQAPHALESFEDNRIVLPLAVLEELDGLKRAEGERGGNARQDIR